ncbi:MAG: diacylglycerol kinase family lipid kinase [Acutalibacter sp.]|jgi:diacylglycerol kinase (ATP)|uniref:diacylglycerol/lipid kinase family protein n=1 Tax=unclassified Acutalibacter TaxID=2620728 RepID=UPI0021708766|nr:MULTISPECIES: diacylglycerol kinase family protein [unclassified Acutalibacter]MCI9224907.1 diacylglycerol kinase family lipid kinase [Acutalibacter sp.]
MKFRILVNPNAGRQVVLRELHSIYRAFAGEENKNEVVMELTVNSAHAAEALDRAIGSRPDTLVCCGGDGTLSATVDRLLKSGEEIKLGYIPAGSTNDFANFLGLPKEPAEAADLIVDGEAKPIDAGRFGERHFIYVASFGAFTQTSYATTQNLKNSLGHLAYIIEGIKELPQLKSYAVRAETAEGGVYEGEYLFGALSNSTSLGGIIKMSAEKVDPADGLFELALVKKPKSLYELNRILLALMGGQVDEELITFVHTAGAAFACAEPMPWSLDGEYVSGGTDVRAEVLPGALKLFR